MFNLVPSLSVCHTNIRYTCNGYTFSPILAAGGELTHRATGVCVLKTTDDAHGPAGSTAGQAKLMAQVLSRTWLCEACCCFPRPPAV